MVSLPSEPEPVKNTWFMPAGASWEMEWASSSTGGWAVWKKVL